MSQIRFAFGDNTAPLELAAKAVELDGNVGKYHRQLAEVTGVMAQHANLFQLLGLARRFKKEIDAAVSLDPNDIQALRSAGVLFGRARTRGWRQSPSPYGGRTDWPYRPGTGL
jgi:hypothetical protein